MLYYTVLYYTILFSGGTDVKDANDWACEGFRSVPLRLLGRGPPVLGLAPLRLSKGRCPSFLGSKPTILVSATRGTPRGGED